MHLLFGLGAFFFKKGRIVPQGFGPVTGSEACLGQHPA